LKDEEAKGTHSTEEKVSVLQELLDVYREKLRLDLMVADAERDPRPPAGQPPRPRPAAAQYESMKRWPDLVSTLSKTAQRLPVPAEKVATYLRIANLYLEKFPTRPRRSRPSRPRSTSIPTNLEAGAHPKAVYENGATGRVDRAPAGDIARVVDGGERLAKTGRAGQARPDS